MFLRKMGANTIHGFRILPKKSAVNVQTACYFANSFGNFAQAVSIFCAILRKKPPFRLKPARFLRTCGVFRPGCAQKEPAGTGGLFPCSFRVFRPAAQAGGLFRQGRGGRHPSAFRLWAGGAFCAAGPFDPGRPAFATAVWWIRAAPPDTPVPDGAAPPFPP